MVPLNNVVYDKLPAARAYFRALCREAGNDEDDGIAEATVWRDDDDNDDESDGSDEESDVDGAERRLGASHTAAVSAAELTALREGHTWLSEQADRLYECAPTPATLRELQAVLTELGPAGGSSGGSSDGASFSADWAPETVVARVIAVKDALTRDVRRQARRGGSGEDYENDEGEEHHNTPGHSRLSRFKQSRQSASLASSSSSAAARRHSSATPRGVAASAEGCADDASIAAAALAAQVPGLALTSKERRGGRKERSADDPGAAAGQSFWASEEDGEEEGARVSLALEVESLRQQLSVALAANEALHDQLRDVNGVIETTATVL